MDAAGSVKRADREIRRLEHLDIGSLSHWFTETSGAPAAGPSTLTVLQVSLLMVQ
jgi:hypothetical protein